MRPVVGVRHAAMFISAVEAVSLEARLLQSLGRRISRRDNSANNVTIPEAISIAPSQYWDGNGKNKR